ncbi:uncharacterized protein BYT42DRAFT_561309 [Radiomyces spectabilis]|uniref:uncharacterized protein n=1 Tax=Radiomyces spectabilis TaxID=64574 RepID=UPI002220514C|nr:uncharacterized protein BYT42DRAFT_561309 [Radiomyces spectabilis]KAI8388806.1 hypothetical protein BYT42DRAFT_561309 [Radiomyces spectabilis]
MVEQGYEMVVWRQVDLTRLDRKMSGDTLWTLFPHTIVPLGCAIVIVVAELKNTVKVGVTCCCVILGSVCFVVAKTQCLICVIRSQGRHYTFTTYMVGCCLFCYGNDHYRE